MADDVCFRAGNRAVRRNSVGCRARRESADDRGRARCACRHIHSVLHRRPGAVGCRLVYAGLYRGIRMHDDNSRTYPQP